MILPRLRSNLPDQGLLGAVSELRTGNLFGYTEGVSPPGELPLLRDRGGVALQGALLLVGTVRFVAMFRCSVTCAQKRLIDRSHPDGACLTF